MKKAFITGVTGFAGSFLAEALDATNEYTVSGTSISETHIENVSAIKDKLQLHILNLLDTAAVEKIIAEVKPDVVFHLAALTSVGDSFHNPTETIVNNASAQIALLEAIRKTKLSETKIIVASSSHVYGIVKPENLPIDETTPFNPENPYSVSKITQDYIALQYYLSYKMPIVRIRPFNHIGPRQAPTLAVSRFAKQIAEIEKGKIEPVLTVGNLETRRDYIDVRDVVKAYILAVEKGIDGDVYNVGSGVSYKIGDILDKLLALSTKKVEVKEDPALLRPSEIPELRCNPKKFEDVTGWKPEMPLEQSLRDVLEYWRNNG